MPSGITRYYKSLMHHRAMSSMDKQRNSSDYLPPIEATCQQFTNVQEESRLLYKLPLEVRVIIYNMALEAAVDVVHVLKKKSKRTLEYVRCKWECEMDFNYRCSAASHSDDPQFAESPLLTGFLPLLQTSRKV